MAAEYAAELPDEITLYFDTMDASGLGAVVAHCDVLRRSADEFAVRFRTTAEARA